MYMFDIHICLIYIIYNHYLQAPFQSKSTHVFSHPSILGAPFAPEARLLPSEVFGEGSMGAHLQRNASARAWSTALGGLGVPWMVGM